MTRVQFRDMEHLNGEGDFTDHTSENHRHRGSDYSEDDNGDLANLHEFTAKHKNRRRQSVSAESKYR